MPTSGAVDAMAPNCEWTSALAVEQSFHRSDASNLQIIYVYTKTI